MTAIFHLIDAQADRRRVLADHLAAEHRWQIRCFASLAEAAGDADQTPQPNLVLAAIDDAEGRAAAALWPARNPEIPLVALIAPGEAPMPDVAANVVRPIRISGLVELLARLSVADDRPRIGPYRLDRRAKALCRASPDPAHVRLTEKELAILDRLIAADGAVVTRDQLREDLFGYSAHAATHTVETHIYRLRRKLTEKAGLASALITEPGGYRLDCG